MSSTSLRNAAVAVVLTALLALSAKPALAQPLGGPQEPARIETGFMTRVWRWLAEVWTPPETPQAQEKSLASGTATTDSSPSTGIDRAGAFDPNG